jgi:methyl coenzyme M reductase subunit C-like uncharacterized protein (methanogenesis marker protein 7)
MVAKFAKYIKTGAARTRAAVQMLLGDAHFPHSHMQVDTYLKKYGDKAELARVGAAMHGVAIYLNLLTVDYVTLRLMLSRTLCLS